MPLAVRDRLARIRQQVEDRVAKAATSGTTVTLSAKKMPLAEVFKAIEKQTGNKLHRQSRGAGRRRREERATITIELKDEPFWPAIDQILDQAKLGIYSYGGEDALSIVARGDDDGPRHGQAAYNGPFRMEVLEVQAQRNLRQPKQTVAQAATGSRLGAAAAADRDLAAGRRCARRRPMTAAS